ncbi:sensor histidine kinase [Streptomyces sp. SID13726]|uniref:sensor histidine kinase n=1 Tax=Streptomyces sp. SID13726 TaxID=2706058 RepID=UPI0013BBBAB8|nr:sensor histidine kinase [Streptomyces sp. SID13726]NEA99291.1 sensor histidine kinase [Streptomyces sp. SID13726]
MKSVSARGCAVGAGIGALFAAVVVDVAYANAADGPSWSLAATLLLGGAAVLWPAARRPARLTPQLRTALPAALSLVCTLDSVVRTGILFGPGELLILLCLLFVAVRHCPRNWVVACAALDGAAVLALPVRPFLSQHDTMLGFMLIGLVLVGLTVAFAAYLRSQDYRRTVAVSETRRSERLAIAADLHDFVAHHVTGILVQTQMARMMTDSGRDDLDPVLAGIERAATEALASMRRTVGVLRDTDEAADRRPVGDLVGIAGLVDGFTTPIQKAVLHREADVPGDLPHEVQAAAFRVVQEALTNVRRHAGDATEVTVGLRYGRARLEVSVSDDGRGGSQLPAAAHGGGFGLVGLKERVTALGGELHAGPRAGYGWEVRAVFPG